MSYTDERLSRPNYKSSGYISTGYPSRREDDPKMINEFTEVDLRAE